MDKDLKTKIDKLFDKDPNDLTLNEALLIDMNYKKKKVENDERMRVQGRREVIDKLKNSKIKSEILGYMMYNYSEYIACKDIKEISEDIFKILLKEVKDYE